MANTYHEIPLRDGSVAGVVNSIIGQMSDGYWENKDMYNKYWMFASVDFNRNVLQIDEDATFSRRMPKWYPRKGATWKTITTYNAFKYMSDEDIKKFMARKAKFLIGEEGLAWDRTSTQEVTWMDKRDNTGARVPLTVAEVCSSYSWLMGKTA